MSFEITQERPTPKLWLAKPNKTVIQRINGIEDLSGNFNFMNQTTLTFNINSHLFDEMTQEQRKNPVIPKIRNKYLIKFEYNGQEDWLVINDKTNLAQEKDFITVNAEYIGSELNTKRIGDIEEIGATISSLMNKFLPTSALNWSVKHIDPKLAKIKREYNLTDASVSTLLEAISTQTDAVIVFHNKDRQLSFIHRDNAGKFRGLKVKETTYLKSFRDQEVSSDLITRLVLFGNEGLTINGINPAGTSYIEDFSYYMKPFERDSRRNVIRHSDYMSDELCHALLDYQEYFNTKKDDYENLSEDYNKLIKEQLEEDLKLSEISATLRNLEERNEILKPRGAYTEKQIRGNTGFSALHNTYYIMVVKNEGSLARVTFGDQEQLVMPNEYAYFKMKTPSKNKSDVGESHLSYTLKVTSANPNLVAGFSTSSEEDFREEDVKELDKKYNVFKYRELYATQYPIVVAVNKRLEEYNQNRKNINDSLSAQNFFTKELLEEREQFVNWGVWREENHTDAKALLEDGMKQLKEKNNVVRTTSVDIVDFIQSLAPEDRKNWSKLKAGDKIRFSSDTYDADLEAFISDLSINFDSHEVTLTLSDIIDLHDKSRGVANQLASFMSTANQVNLQKSMIDENAGKTNKVIALLEAEWDANKKRILAGNETVDIGSHGIKIVSPTHPNEMLMAVAGVIAISDDYGETFKQAINTRGVVAERLIGKALIGTELVMENESGTFRFDDDGVTINAAHFHLVADDGEDYFDNLMQSIEESFVTYEERIKADTKQQMESLDKEINDVSTNMKSYTDELLQALADGLLSQQEIHSLKLQMNMLEADYSQVERRVKPILSDSELDLTIKEHLFEAYEDIDRDYEKLVKFIQSLDEPAEIPQETIKEIAELLKRFKPAINNLVELLETALENSTQNRIKNAEYNSSSFAELLHQDLSDELVDLTEALDGFDLGFKGALADGVLDMIERANISDNLLRLESEKEDVDNRYDVLVTHEHLKNTSQRTKFQSSKKDYDLAYNKLIEQINFILAREKFTPEMLNEYTIRYKKLGETFTAYSATYEQTVEFVQNQYADTKLGQAQLYADGLKREVDADIKDVADNIADFEADVYGAFADGIITERERARLKIHHDMLEKEKSDVIERYNTIITNQYLQGFYDTENLVRARSEYGEIHANLLLSLEAAMLDNVITKEEADLAMRQFGEYVEKLTVFSRELELGIAAIGESKAVYQTEEELKNYISLNVFNDKIAQMQATLDGHIMTWYYDHTPSLTNVPAKDWTTNDEKDSHLGDLFYHQTTGKAYRFMKQGSTYKWELIKDTEVTKALKDAQDAIDLADSKRRVFVTTPKAPYDIGDLWIKSDGELMRARTAKDKDGVFSEVDWIVATKYTDDTKANAVANQLNDFKNQVNTEFEDLSGALTAFKDTVEGVFKDGIVEEYELKILQTQQLSLDREKADVDALYNQLLGRPNLTTLESSTLVNRYNSFNSTHNTLKTTITNVVADGKITEKEYNDTINALNNYPIELQKIKTYMNELIQSLIEKAQNTAEDAIQRFDTWRSSSFEVDSEKIATRVGESSWKEKYLPVVKENISGIGSENLIPYSNIVNYIDQWDTVEQGTERRTILTAPNTGNAAYDNTARIYSSTVLSEQYFGVRSKPLVKNIIEGETYTLSFKTTNHASSYTDMRYTYLMRETSGSNQGLNTIIKTTETTRADGVLAYHHIATFQANFSGKASIMIATRSTSDIAAQFHLYEPMFVQGKSVPQWTSSPNDQIQDFYNTEIKSNYSTTKQTKELLGSYVTSTELQGNLDKIATYATSYNVGKGSAEFLREANGSVFDDAFSYEITAHTPSVSDSLVVVVLNSKGKGKGWDLETLEEKGTTGSHPRIYFSGSYPAITKWTTATKSEVQVIYTKYAGSFTNLSKTNSMIEQKADVITSRVANISSNRPNIIPYTDFTVDSDKWGSTGSDSWYALNSSTRLSLSWDNYLLGNNDSTATAQFIGIFTPVFTQNVVSGREITLSFLGAYPGQVETFNRIALRNMDTGAYQWFSAPGSTVMEYTPIDQTTQPGYNHGLYTITVTPNFSGKARFLIGGHISGDPVAAWIRISNVKVEKAGNASAYTPSSNDANERWSQIKQTTDNITSEVGKKVGNNEIISKINQSAEKVSINADKINLTAGSAIDIAIQNTAHPNPNLIPNSNFWSYPSEDFYYNHSLSVVNESQSGLFTTPTFGRGWVKLRNSTLDSDSGLTYMWTQNGGRNRFSITAGQEYTFSILVAQNYNGNDLNYCYIREVTGGTSQINLATASGVKRTKFLVGRTYGRPVYKYIFTFTPNFGGSNTYMFFGMSNRAESRAGYYLSEWKLEAGDQASPYNENYASKDHIISAINMDTSGVAISGDKVNITAKDIAIDGKTINIGANPSITGLKSDVGKASSAASSAQEQADAARNGNNVVKSINNSGTTVDISASRINLNGDITNVSGYMRVNSLNFNRATATGGSGSSTLKLSGDEIDLRGTYRKTWRGITKNYDTYTRLKNGHLRFRNETENRSLYYSDFGVSTTVDGEGDGEASGTLSFFDHTYSSTARGVTLHSSAGVVGLKSERNSVMIESGSNAYVYVVSNRLRVIRNADRLDSFSELQFSDGMANSIRVTDERADFYIGVSTNELRVTNNLRYNSGNIGWRPVHASTFKAEGSMIMESHSGVNAYLGVGTKRLRVTNNNGYNGGNTGYREIDAADFNHASSEKFKTDITEWDYNVLDVFRNEVKLYQYKLKADADTENSFYRRGVILERETPPEWISGETVKSYEMTSWAIKGIQELAYENDELKAKNEELENRLKKIEDMLA